MVVADTVTVALPCVRYRFVYRLVFDKMYFVRGEMGLMGVVYMKRK